MNDSVYRLVEDRIGSLLQAKQRFEKSLALNEKERDELFSALARIDVELDDLRAVPARRPSSP